MIFYCVGIAVLIIVDQAVKVLVDRHMMFGDTIPVINNFFHITYVQNRGIAYCVGIAVLIIVDQAVKVLVDRHMMFGDTIPVINNFFHITYVQNRGIAFGIFQGKVDVISIATIAAILGIIIYFLKNVKKSNLFERMAYVFIISGAIGNMIDRLLRGYVVDIKMLKNPIFLKEWLMYL